MARNIKKELVSRRDVRYLNKDFQSFRDDLVNYAKTHFSDKIQDFSENGLGGMFIDMSAYVGDVMSYYIDHQFNELNLETAIEESNIKRLIKSSGVDIQGASPAYATVSFYIVVPSKLESGIYVPDPLYIPIVRANTLLDSNSGVTFTLLEDVDFNERDIAGELLAQSKIKTVDSNNNPLNYILKKEGIVISSKFYEESFVIPNNVIPFREITLARPDVNEIISVIDSDKNEYYQVNTLSEDTVFKSYANNENDRYEVANSLEIIPAPRRYEVETNISTNKTLLRFGGGRSESYEDDIIPDPSDHSLPLFGERKTFTKKAINPNSFLETNTFGLAPFNTTITVRYRAGGGQSHNVRSGQIVNIKQIITSFNDGGNISLIRSARSSIEVFNQNPAIGGVDRPTIEDYRFLALNSRSNQNRIVTRQDLISRVYTMPSRFGRVYRAGIVNNFNDPTTVSLSVLSIDSSGKLAVSSDTLKNNLKKYLNEFRLISDVYEIIDGFIANFGIEINVKADKKYNKTLVRRKIFNVLTEYFNIKNFQIDQPISISEVYSLVYNIEGVNEILDVSLFENVGNKSGKSYSSFTYSIEERRQDGRYFPPKGGMFELKFPQNDILVGVK